MNMDYERPPFPIELWEVNYDYPAELFEDLPENKHEAREEKVARMARYAVASALELRCDAAKLLEAATPKPNSSFMTVVRKVRLSHRYGTIEKGDVELKAHELGVYEYIWPLDPKKMKKAIEAERQREESHALLTV